jgi:hypothetical protein
VKTRRRRQVLPFFGDFVGGSSVSQGVWRGSLTTLLRSLLTLCCLLFIGFVDPLEAAEVVNLQVETEPAVKNVQRIGVNLGTWTSWGAEQLMANILKNPGFEGLVDRTVVVVKWRGEHRFTDDAGWLARPDGFWTGARYDVRTGPAAGHVGRVVDSRRTGRDGLPEFITDEETPALTPGDIVTLTRQSDAQLPTHWWIATDARGQVTTSVGQVRPGSSGKRSLSLTVVAKRPAEISSYLDTIGERAGKLLPVNGAWRLAFWGRVENGDPTLTVEFRRQGALPFVSQTIMLEHEWKQFVLPFSATDNGAPASLELRFRTSDSPGRLLLDDVELGPVSTTNDGEPPPAFRAEVIQALQRLRPGYLRDWQGQLGDTLANRLADPTARRASRYRPDGPDGADYGYSLSEFLGLCRLVGARPWIIVPTTFNDEELVELGRFLAGRQATDRFEEILLEFGNENWNAIFRPGAIANPRLYGETADRAFRKIREGAGAGIPLRMVVNGQHANPPYALEFAAATPSADALAVAPYFLSSLQAGLPLSARLNALFAGDEGRLQTIAAGLQKMNKELSLAEVNLHTLGGSAPPSERDRITAGAATGSALARTLLHALALGARRQCAYVLTGYDTSLSETTGLTKLWGIVRDVGATKRFRPTGLAVEMLNKAINGDLYAVHDAENRPMLDLTVNAFRTKAGWSAALASASPTARTVALHFPSTPGALPQRLLRLDTNDPEARNEAREDVRIFEETIAPKDATVSVTLPPWGLIVLLPLEKRP